MSIFLWLYLGNFCFYSLYIFLGSFHLYGHQCCSTSFFDHLPSITSIYGANKQVYILRAINGHYKVIFWICIGNRNTNIVHICCMFRQTPIMVGNADFFFFLHHSRSVYNNEVLDLKTFSIYFVFN